MNDNIVTRFAPSPTGFLHIGGARTAIFNWLFARGRGGKFLLRIEDTDRARHNEAAVDRILEGLAWLGLDFDGEAVSQFSRRERHVEATDALLSAGHAYRCYCTSEETDALREAARAEGRGLRSPWRDRDPREAPTDEAGVIRFKAPLTGETVVKDDVQGDVTIANSQLDDLVLLRSDGAPTYMLAVVVDDHDMAVTHVIRGDDHLTNAARQIQIYEAFGWDAPRFSHVPLIHGSDGAKLSKRHGALGVEAYRQLGYTPEGLTNYLLRLGWSHGDDEIIPRDKALDWFDTDAIGKAPARLDIAKLDSVNAHYMRTLGDDRLLSLYDAYLADNERSPLSEEIRDHLRRALPFLRERSKTLAELEANTQFLTLQRPVDVSGKFAKALNKDGARARIARLADHLRTTEWTVDVLESELSTFAEREGVGFGAIGPATRAALTGGAPAPGLAETLYALGRDEALARIEDQTATEAEIQE